MISANEKLGSHCRKMKRELMLLKEKWGNLKEEGHLIL